MGCQRLVIGQSVNRRSVNRHSVNRRFGQSAIRSTGVRSIGVRSIGCRSIGVRSTVHDPQNWGEVVVNDYERRDALFLCELFHRVFLPVFVPSLDDSVIIIIGILMILCLFKIGRQI